MRKIEIEAWAHRVVETVKSGHKVEDSLVELKSTLIEAKKAARRLAAHANAANGQPILWIIGLDETSGVVQSIQDDLSDWWNQMKSEFDDEAPRSD